MAVLQLEGESAQLRQVARMFASGDITRDDYRNIRTVMIDAFVSDLDALPMPDPEPSGSETLVPVEVPVFVEPARARSATPRSQAASEAEESPMALLAIFGAGAMLLIVATLAMGLG